MGATNLILRHVRFGAPADALELLRAPVPAVAPDAVLVRMRQAPVNPSDVLTLAGRYRHRTALPRAAGYEGVGEVVATGARADSSWRGRRVVPIVPGGGTWRTYLALPPERLVAVPDALGDDTACQAYVNGLTALLLLRECAAEMAAPRILLTAAASAFAKIFLALARDAGIAAAGLVTTQAQLDAMRRRGFDNVYLWAGTAAGAPPEPFDGGRPDILIDSVGGPYAAACARLLGAGGRLVQVGLLSGIALPRDIVDAAGMRVPARAFFLREWLAATPLDAVREALGEVLARLRAASPDLPVARRIPIRDAPAALGAAGPPSSSGKTVLVM